MTLAAMTRLALMLTGASALALAAAAPAVGKGRMVRDFAAGENTEKQACRALARFDDPQAGAVDLYCGPWERPSGFVAIYPASQESAALERLRDQCSGDGQAIASSDFSGLEQIACARSGNEAGARRFGLVARRGGSIIVGAAYPSDWGPMVAAARVLSGAAKAEAVAREAGDSPGMDALRAAYPQGAPGQAAEANYELLRQRAYEQNAIWSFGGAARDFAELLRAHEAVAPDDSEGAAEILAEIGVNLSGERRFQEAGDAFDRAEARARTANARLLLTKIANYRAIDALNQGRRRQAMELAMAANAQREALSAPPSASNVRLTAEQARQIEDAAAASRRGRGLLMSMGELSDSEKVVVLSAQADYVTAVAARGQGRTAEAQAALDRATDRMAASEVQPGWLVAQIYKERSHLRLERGDAFGAVGEARAGLALLRRDAPGTRAEGHLLLALADAKRAAGDVAGALADSRSAVEIFAHHREAPGMPADVAASHLDALRTAYAGGGDPGLADEYFQTLALVWDGAAARSAAQLAARLAASEGGDSVRAYQDAERGYRAALARRERLSSTSDADARMIKAADAELARSSQTLASAEEALRSRSPRYIELLSPQLKAADLRAALSEGEGYIRLVVADDRVYGALITRDAVTPFVADLGEAEASALTDRIRKSVQLKRGGLPDYDMDAAQQLYAKLFKPIEGQLSGLSRLQIDAGGPLAGVPFAALVTAAPNEAVAERIRSDQDYTGVAWFGRGRAIAASLGPAAFVRTRTHPAPAQATAAVTFGDFQPDPHLVAQRVAERQGLSERCRDELESVLRRLGSLPETNGEAVQTAAVFGQNGRAVVQNAFTDRAVLDDPAVGGAEVLLLATHGVLGLSDCFAEPALLASPGADGDGLIEASEILDVKLTARLVVMSACDTAGGGRSDAARTGFADGGEALSGLARAFVYAGASSVLATHWKIDASASALQTQTLLSSAVRTGEPLSQALAEAQARLYDTAETAHPFYWAGFVLIGDGGARLEGGSGQAIASR
ncbi:MAG: CHAT domain-containing protein [Caulobacteraceae bacterium]|nr:CHAT domain-containing protein [Caulobacteraceae bacterium]